MRAGAFAEPRVIDLLNRRFVPFYFNTGGPGLGRDVAAAAFVKGKVKNKWAHLAAFKPDGDYISESGVYADKNEVFEYLVALLEEHPEYNAMTAEEKKVVETATDLPEDARAQARAARLYEELGEYKEAVARYENAASLFKDPKLAGEARLALARIIRYQGKWHKLESRLATVESANADNKLGLAADIAMERGYRLIAQRKYKEARSLLDPAIKAYPESPRLGEMHFYAGVACWFLDDRGWANFHWCWVVENIPDDHMTRRCYTAAASEGMPYENPELDNYSSDHQGGMIEVIQGAYRDALKDYRKLKNDFQSND